MPFNPPIRDSDRRPKKSGSLASQTDIGRMMEVSFLLPCSAFVGWAFGAWLDRIFHQSWIALVGILFGGISGIVYVIRMVTARTLKPGSSSNSESDRESDSDSRNHP